jgi:hypothetical protein
MKITSIALVNYRAFLNKDEKEYQRYELKGLRDFFASALDPALPFQHNTFYVAADNSEQPYIKLGFADGSGFVYSMDKAATTTPGSPEIRTAGNAKGFIGYRDLLRLHFNTDARQPDLFSFFLGPDGLFAGAVLLTPSKPANRVSYRELWGKITGTLDKAAMDDYNLNFIALLTQLEAKVNLLVPFFHEKLEIAITYKPGEVGEKIVLPPRIEFKVKFYGKDIDFTDFLNEARITSLAISVYLAHVLGLPDTPVKVLFLDDIFIGLDNSNRMPLLNILTKADLGDGSTFRHHQLFLTTYDREWFEFAKSYLKAGWQKFEFYVDEQSAAFERPFIKSSETYREAAWSSFLKFDYPGSANYLRKAIESLIRNILPENMLHQGFNANTPEGSQLIVSKNAFKLVEGEDEWYFKRLNAAGAEVEPFHFMGLEALIKRFETLVESYKIPFEMLKELRVIKDRLLNPLSHDNLKSPVYKNELLMGFALADELAAIRSEVIVSVNAGNVVLEIESKDHRGIMYYYVFELLENLRFIHYKTFKGFVSAKCRSLYRQQSNYGPVEQNEKEYASVAKLCEGVFFMSDAPGVKRTTDVTQFMLDHIYKTTYQNLGALI